MTRVEDYDEIEDEGEKITLGRMVGIVTMWIALLAFVAGAAAYAWGLKA